ncbi:MAG: phosphate ABC transporter substrate-binding protein PstS [Gemmataceae bacterium]|nr:phosphate ABC transporter substrate-binding protein PstS [Gemmataceae bacterium]
MRFRSTTLAALAALAVALGCGRRPPESVGTGGTGAAADPKLAGELKALPAAEVNAEGATFIEPIMKFWTSEFRDRTGGKVRINYQGKGSGAGITSMTKRLVAFGCSDAPMNAEQLKAAEDTGGPVVHVPLVIGAVVPVYNLPGVDKPLVFTGPLLADLFTGKVTRWNDPRVKELNPGVNLPDLGVQPVYRSDPSGTSFIFTDYLSKVSAPFKAAVGAKTLPNWPKGLGIAQQKSDGVAGHIARTAGAIGYLELTYALDSKDELKYGSVRNKAGKDVRADLDSITAAAAASLGTKPTDPPYSLHELTYNLTDAPGDGSYPIAGMSFGVLYKKLPGPEGRAVVGFLRWATSAEGQELAKRRNYAPLPEALREQVKARLDGVSVE